MNTGHDIVGVDLVADPSNLIAGVERGKRSVHELGAEMARTGKGADFGAEYARQTERVVRENERVRSSFRDSFAGNLAADFFQQGARAAIDYAQAAIKASAAAADAQRTLKFAATDAGQSYAEAGVKAEEFGRKVGLSNREAASAYAEIQRLAARAGRAGDADQIAQNFADVAAARGLSADRMVEIARGIAAGTDDNALNAIGGRDPGALYDEYAKKARVAANSLDEVQKAQARVNEVQEIAKGATGAANERLNSTAGQLDAARAGYDNLTTSIGDAITTSVDFQNTLSTINDLLGAVTISTAEAQRQLALGLKTPEQLAQENREGFGMQAWNFAKGAVTSPLAIAGLAGASLEYLGAPRYDSNRGFYQPSTEEINARVDAYRNSVENPGQQQYQADLDRFTQLKKALDKQKQDAETAVKRNQERLDNQKADREADVERKRQADAFKRNLQVVSRDENLEGRLAQLRQLETEAVRVGKALKPDDAKEMVESVADAVATTQKAIRDSFKKSGDDAKQFFTSFAERTGDRNPFVKLFVEGGEGAARLQEKVGKLGGAIVNELSQKQLRAIQEEQLGLRFDSQLKALQLRQQAADLYLKRSYEITGQEERQLAVLNKQIEAATKLPALTAKANQLAVDPSIRRNYTPSADYLAGQQFANLVSLGKQYAGMDGAGGRAARGMVDQQLIGLFEGLSPRVRNQVMNDFSDPRNRNAREEFAGAYSRQAEQLQQSVRDEIERARVGDQAVRNAEQQVALIHNLQRDAARAGVDPASATREADKNLLAVLGKLDPKELTAPLRGELIEATTREAERESRREQEAMKVYAAQMNFFGKIDGLLTAQGLRTVSDAASITAASLPAANPASVLTGTERAQAENARAHEQARMTARQPYGFAGDRARSDEERRQAGMSQDERIESLVKGRAAGNLFADLRGLASAGLTSVGDPVAVNKYAQELFRARPGYTRANDPRAFDADDPYAREFFRAGYFDSYHSVKSSLDGGIDPEVRKQYLAVTGALSEKELTPELRRGRIGALEAEAKREAGKEKQAEQEIAERRRFFEAINKILTDKGLKVDGATATLRLVNDTSARIDEESLGAPTMN